LCVDHHLRSVIEDVLIVHPVGLSVIETGVDGLERRQGLRWPGCRGENGGVQGGQGSSTPRILCRDDAIEVLSQANNPLTGEHAED
jgi:hypothetical protein